MPELGEQQHPFIQETMQIVRRTELPPTTEELRKLAEKHHVTFIGKGKQSIVFATKDRPDIVYATSIGHLGPYEAKVIFYEHDILSALFPHNIPHLYAAFGAEIQEHPNFVISDFGLSGTVRQRIETVKEGKPVSILYPFSNVIEVCLALGIPLSFESDDFNFLKAENGGEYYVDLLKPTNQVWNKERIHSYMVTQNFSSDVIRHIDASVTRLNQLVR